MARSDLAQAPALLAPEGWNFEVHELERLHRCGGAVGAYEGDALVGFLSYVDNRPMRWVGNVAVSPDLRGKGVGARLVAKAVEGAPRTGLYAVEKAVTLYARGGFVAHGEAFAYRASQARPLRPATAERFGAADLLDVARYDRHETALDRGLLLRELVKAFPDACRVVRKRGVIVGYGIAKTYAEVTEVGPIVASAPEVAEDLLDALLAATNGPHEVTVLGSNAKARAALERRGFAPAFRTVPMYRGEPPAWRAGALAAAAGLEKS